MTIRLTWRFVSFRPAEELDILLKRRFRPTTRYGRNGYQSSRRQLYINKFK